MTTTPYRSSVPGGHDGFAQLLLAEWTKLSSVPRWVLTMMAAVVLTLLVAMLTAAGAGSDAVRVGDGPGGFEHRSLNGDGSLVARVVAQDDSHGWAKAGLMISESARRDSPYAAVMVTPDHGVRLQSSVATDVAGGAGTVPRWLKLTRAGGSVAGYESADGATWRRVGAVELDGLPAAVEAGPFVASPDVTKVERQFGSESITQHATVGTATFDRVSVKSTPRDGTLRLTGSGDIGPDAYRDDVIRTVLTSVLVGLLAIVALAVLFITSEYHRGTIRTTFAASPRRGRVLAAKAIVLGAATFAAGLVASFGAYLLSEPLQDPASSLSDGPVLRAVVGTAALLAVVAVLSLGVATILRRSAAAIAVIVLVLLVPGIVATGLPLSTAMWLERITPAAGFAIQQTVHRYDTAIDPWAGFGVLCGYAVVALAVAGWLIERRDA